MPAKTPGRLTPQIGNRSPAGCQLLRFLAADPEQPGALASNVAGHPSDPRCTTGRRRAPARVRQTNRHRQAARGGVTRRDDRQHRSRRTVLAVVPAVTGAPGDRSTSLTAAIQRELTGRGRPRRQATAVA